MKKKGNHYLVGTLLGLLLSMPSAKAQIFDDMFSDSSWDQNSIIMAKYSPLYYELNFGANVNKDNCSADFLYLAIGYNKPSTSNEWNKFISNSQTGTPPSQPSEPSQPSQPSGGPSGNNGGSQPSQPSQPSAPAGSMDGLHAGMAAIGWQHYFNHVIGFHVQVGWGFVFDLGSDDNDNDAQQRASSSQSSSDQEMDEKDTFIYNGIPTQIGVNVNLWEHLTLQVGTTYMWKEKPYITLGIGCTF